MPGREAGKGQAGRAVSGQFNGIRGDSAMDQAFGMQGANRLEQASCEGNQTVLPQRAKAKALAKSERRGYRGRDNVREVAEGPDVINGEQGGQTSPHLESGCREPPCDGDRREYGGVPEDHVDRLVGGSRPRPLKDSPGPGLKDSSADVVGVERIRVPLRRIGAQRGRRLSAGRQAEPIREGDRFG